MKTATKDSDIQLFKRKLAEYKSLIDADIASYAKNVQKTTLQQFGSQARIATDAYLEILKRGGKRIRGSLVILGYEMSGGTNQDMILQAARATEMIHSYALIMDDIQDNSKTRRGGPTVHIALADYHRQAQLTGDAEHFGTALALSAMGIGNHAAQIILANLDAPEDLRLKVLSILNRTLILTCHGQTSDIMNELAANVSIEDINRVMELKTAHYTFLNPLHMGMVLAGADCHATDAITDYAIHAGMAFQITDDILGTFSNEYESGKSPMDDIREGKRTLLTQYALNNANNSNKNFLIQTLGNAKLTKLEFERCKDVIVTTGALEYAQKQANGRIKKAISAIEQHQDRWSLEGVTFLKGLATYLASRNA